MCCWFSCSVCVCVFAGKLCRVCCLGDFVCVCVRLGLERNTDWHGSICSALYNVRSVGWLWLV
jgi:hypothetical protein